MKKIFSISLFIILANCSSLFKEKPQLLFVQTGKLASFDGKVLKVSHSSKHIIYFSDRPYRMAGHIDNKTFLDLWEKGRNSFNKDNPNAAISFYNGDGKPRIAIVRLENFKSKKDSFSYSVKVLEGKLEKYMNELSIFIDNSAMPGSVGGVTTAGNAPWTNGGKFDTHYPDSTAQGFLIQ